MPSVIYAMVARPDRILVDCTNERFTGNFRDTALKLLAKANQDQKDRETYILQGHHFSFYLKDGLWFMCMSQEGYGKSMPFVFLADVYDVFSKAYPNPSAADDVAFRPFQLSLTTKILAYSNPEESDKVIKIQKNLDELKDIMTVNIEKAVSRHIAIEHLSDRTHQLECSSQRFKASSEGLRQRMCWSSVKIKLIFALLALIVMYFFVASFCGLNLSYC